MCKEADEPEPKKEIQVIIPDDLPAASKPVELPANPIIPPQHKVDAPATQKISAGPFEDLPLSDINENSKAR